MKAVENQFLPFLEGKKQFVIPIYQRTYSWTREQCEQLWNDIIRTATDPEVGAHFIGSIVFIQRGLFMVANIPQLLVIDGQQRLTTLSLLLVALAKALHTSPSITSVSHDEIYDSYLFNKHGRDEQRYKLLLTQSDKDTLIQLIDDPDRAKTTKTVNRLIDNYRFFEDKIRQSSIDPDTLYLGISKLIIVEISLDRDHDSPQLIFESLNSTGMDLSQADLIRNYVLMGLNNDEQNQLYKQYWYPMEQYFPYANGVSEFDRFMRDYLTLKQGTIPNIDKVYTNFKIYQRSKLTTPISEIVADIYRYAGYFVNMAFLQEADPEIRGTLRDINTLQVNVAYPFFLELYDDYINRRLSRQDFIAILKLVESYVFRRTICGIPTNALNKIFATLAREIDKSHYLESVQASFLSKTFGGRFPQNEEFRAEFVVKNMYNFRNLMYLLSKLENFERKEPVNIQDYTIEHIMPQNEHVSSEWQQELGLNWQELHAKYLHTIGNLTLTGYNPELSDRPFQEKRNMQGGFADSPIRLNRSLAKLERWNATEIEKRAQALADLATEVWPIPYLTGLEANRFSQQAGAESFIEVVGPTVHPQAGFIPAGFKLVQTSGKSIYFFREVEHTWVQYRGIRMRYHTASWESAGRWVREWHKNNEMPRENGGNGIKVEERQSPYTDAEPNNGNVSYSLENYPALQGDMREVFEHLRHRILRLSSSVKEEYKKQYIAYKTVTNFVDVEPQKRRLLVSLNMKFHEIKDPKGLCRDVTNIGHFGNGDAEIGISSLDQLDDVMALVHQSFAKHQEESDVQQL